MTRSFPRVLLAVSAFLALGSFAPTASAQGTQTVALSITVPFTLRGIHPEIISVRAVCSVMIVSQLVGIPGTSLKSIYAVVPPMIPVSQLTRGADGSYSGTSTDSFSVSIPGDTGGKPGSYRCQMLVSVPGGSAWFDAGPDIDARAAVTGPYLVFGEFTW